MLLARPASTDAASIIDCTVVQICQPGNLECLPGSLMQGPVNIHEDVRRAMQVPGENHRDAWFSEFFK